MYKVILLFILFSSYLSEGYSQIFLDEDYSSHLVSNDEFQIIKLEKKIPFQEVLKPSTQKEFKSTPLIKAVVKDDLEYWVKIPFQISCQSDWLFQTFIVHADELDIYIPTTLGYKKKELGTIRLVNDRQVQIPELIFKLNNLKGVQVIYLRLKSKVPVKIEAVFRTEGYFIHYNSRENIFRGVFYGLISLVGLLAFFLYASIREQLYLFYGIYILSALLFNLVQSSVGYFFLWTDCYRLNFFLLRYAAFPLFIFSSAWYCIQYLNIKGTFLNKLLVACAFFGCMIGLEFTGLLPAHVFTAFGSAVYYFMLTSYIILNKRHRAKDDIYFSIGYLTLIIAVIIVFLRLFGFIESTPYTYYAFHSGLIVEAICFTVSLSFRFSKLMKDREASYKEELKLSKINQGLNNELVLQLKSNEKLQAKVNLELETEVKRRTDQLLKKNEQLKVFNQNLENLVGDLEKMNIHLDKSNWKLKRQSIANATDRFLNKHLGWASFQELFPNDLACKRYLSELKWSDGFVCLKCNSQKYYNGKQKLSRKCSSCAYEESATANTLFKGIKFELNKAFYLSHCAIVGVKTPVKELSVLLELNEETCRRFYKKVRQYLDRYSPENAKNILLD